MNNQCELSNTAKNYLTVYYCILNEMIKEMTEAKLTNNISNNFITQMIPHYRAAIEMSHNILKYTTNISLQDIASQIITEQTKSIENMLGIECCCEFPINSKKDLCLYQYRVGQIMQNMFSDMKCATIINQIDCDFMWEMIPHHRGAIKMSENVLQFCICPQLKPILDAIITSQQRGIMQMHNLLQCIGC